MVRFAWALGYKTFTAFHDALQNEVKYRITALEGVELRDGDEVSDASVFEGLAQADTLNIKKTVAVDGVDGLEKTYAPGCNSPRRSTYTARGPAAAGRSIWARTCAPCWAMCAWSAQPGEDPLSAIATIGGNDLLFCVSLPRHTEQTLTLLSYAQAQEACIVTVDEGPDSDTAAWADVNLSAECGDYGVGGFIAPLLTLLNTLVCLIVRSDEKAERRLRLVDELSRYQRKGNGK